MPRLDAPAVFPMLTVGDYLDGKATYEAWVESLAVALLDSLTRPQESQQLPALWWLLPRRAS